MQSLNRNPNPHRRARLSRALAGLASISLLIGGLSSATRAAQPPPEKTGPPNRWLIIVDTSRPMESRSETARQIAGILVLSGMNGQMHRGDTLGLWTFNQTLYAGQFPLQEWRPETARNTAQRIVTFLQEQTNEKSSRMDKVMPEVDKLIKGSEYITVIIISDGSSKISGTPYDDKINGTYDSWRKQQKKNQMPFITLLRAKRGLINDYVVNTPPWQLELPPLPAELQPPPATPKPAGVRITPDSSKPPAGSLIVSGAKANPTPAADPAIITASSNSATTDLAANSTNHPDITRVVPVQPAKADQPAPVTPSGVVPVMAAETAKSNAPAPAATAGPTPPTALVATTLAAATPNAPSTPPASDVDTHPAAQDDSSATKPGPTTMGLFISGLLSPRNLFIGVGALLVLMIVIMIVRTRQPQPAPSRISLITRSLDQEQ